LPGQAQGPACFILDETSVNYAGGQLGAANGDATYLTFTGHFIPSATPGVLDNVEALEIVGGTGRFEGASGTRIVAGQLDAATLLLPAPAPFVGTLSSPASLKN